MLWIRKQGCATGVAEEDSEGGDLIKFEFHTLIFGRIFANYLTDNSDHCMTKILQRD